MFYLCMSIYSTFARIVHDITSWTRLVLSLHANAIPTNLVVLEYCCCKGLVAVLALTHPSFILAIHSYRSSRTHDRGTYVGTYMLFIQYIDTDILTDTLMYLYTPSHTRTHRKQEFAKEEDSA